MEMLRCVCGRPATCFGSYESSDNFGYGCDECCGHGNEDGWCLGPDEWEDIGEQRAFEAGRACRRGEIERVRGLVRAAIRGANTPRETKEFHWANVRDIFGVGRTSAHELCEEFGFNYDTGEEEDRLPGIDDAVSHGALDHEPGDWRVVESDMMWLIDEVKRQRKLRDEAYDWAMQANRKRDEAEAALAKAMDAVRSSEEAADTFFEQRNAARRRAQNNADS